MLHTPLLQTRGGGGPKSGRKHPSKLLFQDENIGQPEREVLPQGLQPRPRTPEPEALGDSLGDSRAAETLVRGR